MNAREECYARLKEKIYDTLRIYYNKFPKRLNDDRSTDAIDWSLKGLNEFYGILDEYEITFKEKKTK